MPPLQKPSKKQPPVNLIKRRQQTPLEDQPYRQDYSIGETTDPSRFEGPAKQNRGLNPERHTGHLQGSGDGSRLSAASTPATTAAPSSANLPSNVVNQIVLQHLQAIGQAPGPQPGTALGQTPTDLGLPPGGQQMPGGPGQGSQGMDPGTGPGSTRGNPIEGFLGQVLNPRASSAGGAGAVPTLPGAPQGFDLWHMLQLVHMLKSLYSSLPVEGSSAGLPTGTPGPGY